MFQPDVQEEVSEDVKTKSDCAEKNKAVTQRRLSALCWTLQRPSRVIPAPRRTVEVSRTQPRGGSARLQSRNVQKLVGKLRPLHA